MYLPLFVIRSPFNQNNLYNIFILFAIQLICNIEKGQATTRNLKKFITSIQLEIRRQMARKGLHRYVSRLMRNEITQLSTFCIFFELILLLLGFPLCLFMKTVFNFPQTQAKFNCMEKCKFFAFLAPEFNYLFLINFKLWYQLLFTSAKYLNLLL